MRSHSDAVPHPTAETIASVRSTTERLESHTKPRVVCSYCAWKLSPGQEPASHGICSEKACLQLATEVITTETVIEMHRIASRANAAYVRAKHYGNPAVEKEAWDAAEYRFRTALRLMVEDMERGR